MKIAFYALNQNFCGSIIEEFRSHHDLRVYKPLGDSLMDLANITGLLEWCDLAYFDFCQTPLPEVSQLQYVTKPIVARMDGIDILNHDKIDWRVVSGLILMPVQERRLERLRENWHQGNPGKRLTPLPKRILKRNIGIDLSLFKPDYARKPGYNIVLHASVIRDTKRVYTALQCFYDLIKQDPASPWRLTIIGQWEGGWNWQNRQEYVMSTSELLDILRFPKERLSLIQRDLPREKWAEFVQGQDIYWCLSHREGFPNSMGEALASGVNPITNYWYAAEELYPEEALCRSPGEIVEKTIAWGRLPDDLKIELRKKCRAHAEQWDRHKVAQEIRLFCEQIYEEDKR